MTKCKKIDGCEPDPDFLKIFELKAHAAKLWLHVCETYSDATIIHASQDWRAFHGRARYDRIIQIADEYKKVNP